MRTLTKEQLKEILDKHLKWLRCDDGGERADLRSADLRSADLRYADLSYADLRSADLSSADLSYADLRSADLRSADLSSADLRSADLRSADLRYADLRSAKIEDKLLNKFYPIACPESGAFVAWKKASGKIVKLEVCEDAKRSSAFTRKCRCSAARVLAIENADGTDSGMTEIASNYDSDFIYKVGEIISVENFDEDRKNECAPGIHFFITRQEAVDW